MVARVFDLPPADAPDASPDEAASDLRRLLHTRAHAEPPALRDEDFLAPRVGRIVSADTRSVQVMFAGAARPTPARLAISATLAELESACVEQREVLLMFERADRTKPIITGLLSAAPSAPQEQEPHAVVPQGLALEVDADGQRVRLSAQDQIVLQCGKASVTLTSSGRVILRGTYVETHASGTNRIKGGQVRIN